MGGHGGPRRRLIVPQQAPDCFSFPASQKLAALPDAPPAEAEGRLVPLKPYEGKDSVGFRKLVAIQAAARESWEPPPPTSHKQVEVEVPERLGGIMLREPNNLKARLKAAAGGAHLDVLQTIGIGESAISVFRLHGPGSMVDKAHAMLEEMLLTVYRNEGIANIDLELRVADREHELRWEREGDLEYVEVMVDGAMETVQVHRLKGPLLLQVDGSYRPWSKEGNGGGGHYESLKEWRGLGATDKEVYLVMAAKRQRMINHRRRELEGGTPNGW